MRVFPALAAVAAAVAAAHVPAVALEDVPKEGGFSGYVIVGGGYGSFETNLVAATALFDVGEETVVSLGDAPGSTSAFLPVVDGEVRYTFGQRRLQLFLGTSLEDLVTLDNAQNLGVRWQSERLGILQAGLVSSGLATEVWADPYVAGAPRDETDRTSAGVRLRWDRILGSGFQVSLTSQDVEIDDERSGESLGLSAADRALLRREGTRTRVEAQYTWRLSDRHVLQPALGLVKEDRDGAALSGDGAYARVSYAYVGGKNQFAASLLAGETSYDAENPVFGRAQDATNLAFSGTYIRQLAAGPWSLVGNVTFAKEDSDVDFHDGQALATTLAVRYRFD